MCCWNLAFPFLSCSMCVVLYLYQSEGAIIGWRLHLSSILCGMIFVIEYLLIYSKTSNPSPVKVSRLEFSVVEDAGLIEDSTRAQTDCGRTAGQAIRTF